jgi:hypothetical protein
VPHLPRAQGRVEREGKGGAQVSLVRCTGPDGTGCRAQGKPSLIEDGKPCCRACRSEAMQNGGSDPWAGLPWLGSGRHRTSGGLVPCPGFDGNGCSRGTLIVPGGLCKDCRATANNPKPKRRRLPNERQAVRP